MKEHTTTKVLLVEDETTLAMIIKDTLEDEGFEVYYASDGLKGLSAFAAYKPSLVIADVMMPGMDGFEMVKRLRKQDATTPILFLTARSSLDDLVNGFNLGANDYLRKPFKMLELVMRVKALTKQIVPTTAAAEAEVQIGRYKLNTLTQELWEEGGERQELSFLETEILKRLGNVPNQVVEARALLNELWNDDSSYNRNSLHVFIHKLRHRLAADATVRILNVRGVGYKLTLSQTATGHSPVASLP
ncbi:MAG: response regulator transcription factor [Mediterranea sp.]|jgi:DNA-binding response OmpR family regulator|nr:response regulator transcription factor [Mediterranea sp.]